MAKPIVETHLFVERDFSLFTGAQLSLTVLAAPALLAFTDVVGPIWLADAMRPTGQWFGTGIEALFTGFTYNCRDSFGWGGGASPLPWRPWQTHL